MRLVIATAAIFALTSCAHTDLYQSELQASGPKVVTLEAPRRPWVIEIEKRLRQAGFQVLRWESTQVVTQAEGTGKVTTYREAAAPYVLRVDGDANLSWAHRCMGGGFNFSFINAELIDVRSNQTLSSYSGQGYSEGCAPLSGKVFTNITNMVSSAWSK